MQEVKNTQTEFKLDFIHNYIGIGMECKSFFLYKYKEDKHFLLLFLESRDFFYTSTYYCQNTILETQNKIQVEKKLLREEEKKHVYWENSIIYFPRHTRYLKKTTQRVLFS